MTSLEYVTRSLENFVNIWSVSLKNNWLFQTPPPQLSVVPGVTLMPGQAQKEASSAAKGDAPAAQQKVEPPMEPVQEQPTEEDDLEME